MTFHYPSSGFDGRGRGWQRRFGWAVLAWGAAAFSCLALAQSPVQPQIRMGSGAWQPAPAVIRAQSNLVPLEVVVRRSSGDAVGGLNRSNFRVLDNGHLRSITQFSVLTTSAPPPPIPVVGGSTPPPASRLPVAAPAARTVALWFDDVNTDRRDLARSRNAAERFLQYGRGKDDQIGVFTASGAVTLGFTGETAALTRAIASIRARPRESEYGLRASCPRITPFEAYQIAVLRLPAAFQAAAAEKAACAGVRDSLTGQAMTEFESPENTDIEAQADATWQLARSIGQDTLASIFGMVKLLASQPGKRILLIASGGFLSETLGASRQRIVDAALHAHVVINAIDARGLYTQSPVRPLGQESDAGVLPLLTFFYETESQLGSDEAGNGAMVNLAQSTGGLFFQNDNDLELGFRRLGLAPAVTYELAFAPASLPRDGKFHRLKVALAPPVKGAIIQARRGYYDPEPLTPAETLGPALDQAMRGRVQTNGVPVTIQVLPESGGAGMDEHYAVGRLRLVTANGRRRQQLITIVGLFGPDGRFITGERAELDLALDGAHYKYFRTHGLGATLKLKAPPGTYRLRVVIGEASDAKVSAFTREVVVR